ncbi:TolC family protein [Terriglobus roseus]|nr:TolC family protein [Terriglobus roseus]
MRTKIQFIPGVAALLLSPAFAGAQVTPPAQPVAPPPTPAITTARTASKQPPIGDAMNLPEAPAPQTASAAVIDQLKSAAPRDLGHGVQTPTATAQPLLLSLDDAVRLGLEHNLTISVDLQNQRQITGLQLTAFNALIPSLTASAQSSTQELNLAAMGFKPSSLVGLLPAGVTFSTIVKVSTTSARLSLSQQLFNLPAFEVYRAAKAQADVAKWNILLDRGDIVQQVASQYLRVLADTASITNAQSQVASDTELERQSQARKDAGTGTNLDLLRARVERQTREQELIADVATFEKDKIQLNRLMGIAADQPLQLTDAVPYHELEALPLDVAKQVAFKRRKDLLSLQAQLRSTELQRRAIAYERLPVVKVNGFYGVLGQTTGLYHGVFSAQGGIDFPIFQEARIRGDREVADSQLSKLRNQLSGLRGDIEQQIQSAMLDMNTSNELVRDATSNVNLAAEALDETRDRYRAGIDDNLPVVRAQATLANAQAQLVSALFQFNNAKLQLARNTGVVESQFDTYLGD